MSEFNLSVQNIKELMEAMRKNGIGELEIEQENLRLTLLTSEAAQTTPVQAPPQAAAAPPAAAEPKEGALEGRVVTAPIVGTFYAAPGPDKAPYVQPGQLVKKGDVLFIIESMKLMNEVVSEHEGTVGQILVENAKGVEFGQPVMTIL